MNAEQLLILKKLSRGRLPFYAAHYEETKIHRQLVMAGYARCRVEGGGEFILLTREGERALEVRA
jgi:hypothetical protein